MYLLKITFQLKYKYNKKLNKNLILKNNIEKIIKNIYCIFHIQNVD